MLKICTLAAFAVVVTLSSSSVEPAQAESYAACKARMSKSPPCNGNWTRACAAQCGSKF